jgi:hypothetical protein
MNKNKVLAALEPVIRDDHVRRKVITHGYMSLTTVERAAMKPRLEIEEALAESGLGPQPINRIISRGIY